MSQHSDKHLETSRYQYFDKHLKKSYEEYLFWSLIFAPIPLASIYAIYHIYNNIQPYNFLTIYTIGSIIISLITLIIGNVAYFQFHYYQDRQTLLRYFLTVSMIPSFEILMAFVSYHGTIGFWTLLN